jgi:hypothetical protein
VFITKKHLSRRTVLRGLGTSIALPLLDAMIPAHTALAKTAAKGKPRMGFFYLPHGAVMNEWTPKGEGTNFELSRILQPLEPFRSQLTVISGLGNRPAESNATHAITPGTWLSAVPPVKSNAPHGGVTIDQMAALHIGQETPLPSIEVGVTERGGAASCNGTYGCGHGNTISFRTPTTPLPMEADPRKLFNKLFGEGDSEAERATLARDFGSILDMVMDDANALNRRIGERDRAMLSQYLESVREIERRVQKMQASDISKLKLPELPIGVPEFDKQLRLMYDMVALAYEANITRVTTFMLDAEVSNLAYPHLGISDAFHPLSHHNNRPASLEKLAKIQRYHTEVFASFLTKLSKTSDGEGSLLDNAIFLYGSNMSNSDRHDHFPLPLSVVGGGCGTCKGGQHLRYPDRTPIANLLLTLLDRAGVPVDKVGDSTGRFAEV